MKKILPFFLLVLLLASCQKDPDMSKLSDDFVVFTDHNKDANFESFTTFYIPDSVMVIGSSENRNSGVQQKLTISSLLWLVAWKAVVTHVHRIKNLRIWVCRFLL